MIRTSPNKNRFGCSAGRPSLWLAALLAGLLPLLCSCRTLQSLSPADLPEAVAPMLASEQGEDQNATTSPAITEPETTVPETTVPETTVPETTARESVVPASVGMARVSATAASATTRSAAAGMYPPAAGPAAPVANVGWHHAARGPAAHGPYPGRVAPYAMQPYPGLPAQSSAAHAACPHCGPSGCGGGGYGTWSPPGLKQPWPEDEYLCDGGDRNTQVRVGTDWSVKGLDQEDTIAHFDTQDGRTLIEPSNCVCIYAPRFAAVRRVDGLVQYQQDQRMADMNAPQPIVTREEMLVPSTVNQPLQPLRHLAAVPLDTFREQTRGLTVDRTDVPSLAENAFLPFEDFLLIRRGVFDSSEKPRLADRVDAALAWTDNKGVQVVIDDNLATEAVGQSRLESTFSYELHGKPRLRICKVASTHAANPGEIVEFTLRFDNLGDQPIGNVTIIDHLTTRLEYVEDSQSCTLESDFFSIDQNGESLVLRWEVKAPMKVGTGGLIRFKCRVR